MQRPKVEVSVVAPDPDPLPVREVERAIRGVLDAEGVNAASITVVFHSSQKMRALNRATFGRDRSTDVIAFPMEHVGSLVGDVYINPARARQSAREHAIPLRDELLRLVIHGTLHLLGYDHPERGDRTDSPMWRRQERYLARVLEGAA